MSDTTEQYYADMEAARNDAEEKYFAARPQLDSGGPLSVAFRAGFERAFSMLWRAPPRRDLRPDPVDLPPLI